MGGGGGERAPSFVGSGTSCCTYSSSLRLVVRLLALGRDVCVSCHFSALENRGSEGGGGKGVSILDDQVLLGPGASAVGLARKRCRERLARGGGGGKPGRSAGPGSSPGAEGCGLALSAERIWGRSSPETQRGLRLRLQAGRGGISGAQRRRKTAFSSETTVAVMREDGSYFSSRPEALTARERA